MTTKNSKPNQLDTDINNYTIEDLLLIFGLNDPTQNELNIVANKMINKMVSDGNNEIAEFLQNAKEKLFEELYEDEVEYDDHSEQAKQATDTLIEWWKNQYPRKKQESHPLEAVDRNQRVQFFDNSQTTIKQERLNIAESFVVPVAQGYINPNLKNVTTRTVCIDSQFRPNSSSINTDFTIDLSDPLLNTLSIKLYSIQIPRSWYNIDHGYNCFDVSFNGDIFSVYIKPGNYNVEELLKNINTQMPTPDVSFEINNITQKVSINNVSSLNSIEFIFYSEKGFKDTRCVACSSNTYINYNLGWLLGFREFGTQSFEGETGLLLPIESSIEADAIIEMYGPRYFLLVLDDFNQNHLNKGLINSIERGTKLSLPKYINLDNKTCDPSFNRAIFSKSAPRKFTQAQLFTMNSIIDDRKEIRKRVIAPTTSDVLALIPIRNTNDNVIVDYGISLLQNKREYFGPVTIERLKVRLLDDKGNLVNLNKRDWSFSLHVESLYQY